MYIQITNSGVPGSGERRRTKALIDEALGLATRLDDRAALGRIYAAAGVAAKLVGEFKESIDFLDRAFDAFKLLPGVAWERQSARIFLLEDLMWLGQWADLFQRLPRFMEDAQQRGDLYGTSYMRTRIASLSRLAADDPQSAHDQARRGIAEWSPHGFHLPHYYKLYASAQIHLYEGDPRAAFTLLEAHWRALSKSLILSIQAIRVEAHYLRGQVSLAMAAATGDRTHSRRAERLTRGLRRERVGWADAMADGLAAGLAALRGDNQSTLSLLEASAQRFEAVDMALHAAAARRRHGELLGGTAGQQLIDAADSAMSREQIRNPSRMTACLLAMPNT